ncbi:MAG: bifunctional 3-(3-hydroxy-phenyl)propionate/3-hydroxycinnamic acid hydroxylase [Alphaproteobacteria bacterium]
MRGAPANPIRTEVAIVGFGPVGAVLAGLLGRRGIEVVVLERDAALFPLPRAAHIDHQGLRAVQELGCLDALLPDMVRNRALELVSATGETLVHVPADQPSVSGLPLSAYFYQPDFDGCLRRAVSAMPGVRVELGAEVTALEAEDAGVRIAARRGDGRPITVLADYAVGCDGAWSMVRESAGIALDSLNFDEKWLVLDLRFEALPDTLPADRVVQVCDPARPRLTMPISSDRQRFEFMLLPGEDPAAMQRPDTVRRLLDLWLPGARYEVSRAAVYTFHGLVARGWRRGRVTIAGDAAHQMPPFLGQGMCSGLRDATNLAWKLEAVLRRGAAPTLLDSYEAERSPHVRTIVEAAIRFGRLVCETDPAQAAARDRRLLAKDRAEAERIGFKLPRLPRGPLVLDGGGMLFVQPKIGGRWLDDIVGPRPLVLARNAVALGEDANWWRDRLGAHVATLADLPHSDLAAWLDRSGAGVAAVRPDRYVLGTAATLRPLTQAVRPLLAAGAATGAGPARMAGGRT